MSFVKLSQNFTVGVFLFFGTTHAQTQPLLKSLDPKITKVDFSNDILETADLNYFYYDNLYNGAGVAMGDINNDGLPDLYFVSNNGSDQLYLNSGKLKFKNITKKAFPNQDTSGWHTAVSFADVNADGWLDIYVCKHGLGQQTNVVFRNLLYINNHNNTFTESAAEYGLDDPGRSMDADFFDYDQDGDLDVLITNHRENTSIMDQFKRITNLEPWHSNRLYRNDNGKFIDVTKEAGVLSFGYCLSASISDLNNDGWPDIYITGDYNLPDFLFMNQQNGKFRNESKERLRHTSHYSMGIDIADFNNDMYADIFVLDMANKDYVKSKTNMGSMSIGSFWDNVAKGFNYQYMYNTLQLNHGNGFFSEIAHLSGIASTDWSWAPLLVDFDQDGLKDLFATNGYYRDVRDKDFTNALKKYMASNPAVFDIEKMTALIPQSKEINYVFRNMGDLTFKDKSNEWGLTFGTNSNGAAYGDLDNDGDLDLVVNNLNEVATIFENTSNKQNFVKVKLIGPDKNPFAYGAKVIVNTNKGKQIQEVNPSRGYASSSDVLLCFGLGNADSVMSIIVEWNGKVRSELFSPKKNSLLVINYKTSNQELLSKPLPLTNSDEDDFVKLTEIEFDDFRKEVLLPNKMSQLGPFLSKGDVNGDGLEDLFVGGTRNQKATIYLQKSDGSFSKSSQPEIDKDSLHEDAGSIFFDADNDGDLDLYVVSGGNEYNENSDYYLHRFYRNDGSGKFSRDLNAIPKIVCSGQVVLANDFDGDGDIDLFIPGRQIPGKYLIKPESFFLVNENGIFTNEIEEIAPELKQIGMITDAVFSDFDKDGDADLVIVGEWMKPLFYENQNAKFKNVDLLHDEKSLYGWWNCIVPIDVDNDGILEYLVGNLGLNNKFHPTPQFPLRAQLSDFDKNGSLDLVLSKYFGGELHPVRGRECLSEQIPSISERFKTYNDFAKTPFNVIFDEMVQTENVTNFSSGLLVLENGKYHFHPFENLGQIGCINRFVPMHLNADSLIDFIAFGNKYEAEIETPRYDANPGLVFLNQDGNNFKILTLQDFGPYVNKNAKDVVMIGQSLFISNSGESVKRFELFW